MKSFAIITGTVLTLVAVAATGAHAQDAFITSDRTVAGGNPVSGSFTNVYVGLQSNGTTQVANVDADIIAPTAITGNVQTYNNSITNISGGTINQIIQSNTSTVILGGTASVDRVTVDTGTNFSMTGGSVTGTNGILTRGASADVTGGTISHLNSNGGTGVGTVSIRGGTLGENGNFIRRNNTTTAGLLNQKYETTLTVLGGTVNALQADRGITIIQSGATINGGIRVSQPVINVQDLISTRIMGGAINGGVVGLTDAGISISGGLFDAGIDGRTFATLGRSTIAFTGIDLVVSAPTAATWTWDGFTFTGDNYTIAGRLSDGTAINRILFDQTGAGNTGSFSVINVAASAPEPGSLALLALPLVGAIVARRRKN